MASGSVTASTEADIISDMLKKPFSARQSGEQNIIVTQRPMPNLYNRQLEIEAFRRVGTQRKIGFVVVLLV
jgi:hypothetical protein